MDEGEFIDSYVFREHDSYDMALKGYDYVCETLSFCQC